MQPPNNFLFRIHHAPNRPYLITPDLSGDDLVLLQFESVQRRQFSRSLFSTGIKKSGTFHFICRECDALYFQDYENKEALLNDPTDKMLAEIALKSMLQMLSKRNEEIALFDIFQKRSGAIINKELLDEEK